MQLDRKTWEANQAKGDVRHREREIQLGLSRLAAAAVSAERLTGMAEWDTFLRQVEALQERDRAALEGVKARLCGTHEWLDAADVLELRHTQLFYQSRIEARDQVMNLPREIILAAKAPRSQSRT
jgi:hypothetical protein